MMGGIVGRLFREFAVTLSITILFSLLISLTATPCMCAHLLKHHDVEKHGAVFRFSERCFDKLLAGYRHGLLWALDNSFLMLTVLLLTIALNAVLIVKIPKGFFPRQDTGALQGGMQGPQDASFPVMNASVKKAISVIKQDPAVENVEGYVGQGNGGFVYVALKPLDERKVSADADHQPAAPETEPPPHRLDLSAGRAGSPHRRPGKQRALSIHHTIGQRSGPRALGPDPSE